MTKLAFPSLSALVLLVLAGCQETDREPLTGPNGEPVVYTSIPPLAGLAEKIAGEQILVRSLVSEAQDPHDFSPTPKQLVSLGNASVFFTTEMPFEAVLVEKLQDGAPGLRIVDVAEGIKLKEIDCEHHHHEEAEGEDHDHEHDHDHGGTDPHIWLSPPLLKNQVNTIIETLVSIAPEHETVFRERGEALETEIDEVHAELTEELAPFKGRSFYVYHGAFAYFAEAYGLVQEAIETGGRKPEQKRVVALIQSAREEGVKTIFVQPQFDPDSARTIADQIGGSVVPIDPMARDIFGNLRKISEAISSGK